MTRAVAAAVTLTALLLVACSAGRPGSTTAPPNTSTPSVGPTGIVISAACDSVFSAAAAKDEMHDSVEDLFPAVTACTSLDEWEAAYDRYGGLRFTGDDGVAILRNMCFSDEIANKGLCLELD
jgi:hypothetical protein